MVTSRGKASAKDIDGDCGYIDYSGLRLEFQAAPFLVFVDREFWQLREVLLFYFAPLYGRVNGWVS